MNPSPTISHLYGLIGYPLSHSFSKRYFTEKFQREGIQGCHYELFPLEQIEALAGLLERYPNLKGLNVTIPYKQQVMAYLNELDKEAAAVGAVNTIRIEQGRLSGYNTDVYGFEQSLLNFLEAQGRRAEGLQALVLGTGGASRAVVYVLQKLGIVYRMVSRQASEGRLSYRQLDATHLAQHHLLINTTPLGMAPQVDSFPDIPYYLLGPRHLLFDLVYNPAQTAFMARGLAQGAAACNGLEMLYLQAEKAWEIWNS
ncbi:MAG: shikimate dehydrogenase [Phaeodactylibacter sp.]|nr:shikimate dehydrogenase [Phaeodactylibacter sp.]